MKRETIQSLGLEVDRIIRDRDFCKGFGKVYFDEAEKISSESKDESETNGEQRELKYLAAATSYRRAAAHSLLLGDLPESQSCFGEAAKVYHKLDNPYSLMMFWLTINFRDNSNRRLDDFSRVDFAINFRDNSDILSWLYSYLFIGIRLPFLKKFYNSFDSNTFAENPKNIRKQLENYRNQPIGILGIQLGNYLDLRDAISQELNGRNSKIDNPISLEEAILPFLYSYDNAIRFAQQNSYHWKRLAMPFHPAEPDIFSILIMTDWVMKSKDARSKEKSIVNLIETIPLRQSTKNLLDDILKSLIRD